MTRKEPFKPVALVVDDDEVGRLICADLLFSNGFDVIEADDGEPALEFFKQHKPDIILMDVMMKKMDGFAACRALRSLPGGATVPILMVTGLNDIDSIEKAYDAGATDFIGKPFDWRILINRVRYMLRAERQFDCLRATEHALSQAQRIAQLGSFRWKAGSQTGRGFRKPGKPPRNPGRRRHCIAAKDAAAGSSQRSTCSDDGAARSWE